MGMMLHARARLRRIFARALLLFAAAVSGVAHADSPAPTSFPTTGSYTPRLQGSRNNVAIVEMAGDYSRNLASGEFNVEPRTEVAKEFYRHYADRYDFIVVFSNFEYSTGDAVAFYVGVKNDTRGLGMPLFDNGPEFGSRGVLQGYIDMAALSRYTLNPADPRFEQAMRVLSHELLHRWAAQVRFVDSNGQTSPLLLGRDGSHWSFMLDTGGSVQYGNRWSDNGNGTFTSRPDRQFFSPLDLYLMGMLKREEVPPFFLIRNPEVQAGRLPEPGVTISGTRQDITIDQIVAAEGARQPDADRAQKQFRLGFVLLTRPGQTPTDAEIQSVAAVREAFETRLAALTGGRAIAQAFLEPNQLAVGTAPTIGDPVLRGGGAPANMPTALAWLRGRQQAQGDWADNPSTRLRDTVVAASALTGNGDQSPVDRALAWLSAHNTSNTDYAARRISAITTRAAEADWAQLAASQNQDGGWGIAPGYQSSPLDTALAVIAVAHDPNSTRQARLRERARAFLLSKQNADGGWSHAVNGVSRTATTAHVVRALGTLNAEQQITTAARFLATRQNTDGGFGDSPSTTHDTSNVLLSLASAGMLGEVRANDGFGFLHATQQTDGSWDGSVYATGLALQTLENAQTYNWASSSLTAAPAAVRDGQIVALALTVGNTGAVAAPATSVSVFLGDPSAGVLLTQIPVPPLLAGRSVVVRGAWSTLNRPGEHVLTAVVDAASQGAELTRNDNRSTVRVSVSAAPSAADLVVIASDVQTLPAVVNRIPTTMTVLSQVANIGLADAVGVRVRLLMGPTLASMAVVDERVVNLLGRSSVPVSHSFQLTAPGRQLLAVVVDAESAVADVDRSNNRADLAIETISSYDPAVLASELVVPGQPVSVGSDVILRTTIRNNGTADTPPFQAVLTVSDGTTVREIDRLGVQLGAGASRTLTLPWRADLIGSLNFRVVLDPSAAVADLDRSNNEAQAAFTVVQSPSGPNLAVGFSDFTTVPAPLAEGRPFTLRALVRNIGNEPASNVVVGFYEGDPAAGGLLLAPLQVVPSIAPGASVEVTAIGPDVAGTADRLYFVAVDPANTITESTKEDNAAFRVVPVSARPDLAVSAGNIGFTPSVPRPGDALRVTVAVQNLGQQDATAVLVRITDGNTVLGEQTVPTIAAQSTASVMFDLSLAGQSARVLTVEVDPANTITERDEANNTASRSLAVQNGTAFVSEPYFSPNGDGIKDTVAFGFRLESASVRSVAVVNESGVVVRRFAGFQGLQAEGVVTWDGRDDFQRLVADGIYRLQAIGADGLALSESTVVLDTNRTPILGASGTPAEYYRNLSCQIPSYDTWTTTLDEQSLFFVSNYGSLRGVHRLGVDGGDLRTIVPGTFIPASGEFAVSDLQAAGNGGRIAFIRSGAREVNGQWTYTEEIWTAAGDGSDLRLVASGNGSATTYTRFSRAVLSHDGASVVAQTTSADGTRTMLRRYQTAAGSGSGQVIFDPQQHNNLRIESVDVAPNRRRALVRVFDPATERLTFAIIDFETGAFTRAPAWLDNAHGNSVKASWAPDSRRFVLYGRFADIGVDQGNNIDFEFDVFDADFNLEKRFRTNKGPGDDSWYGGEITGVAWSSDSDEFAFILDPRPYGGGENSSGNVDGPAAKTFYRASMSQDTLTALPVNADVLLPGTWNSSLHWAPGDRRTLKTQPDEYSSSIHVDTGASVALFPRWREQQNSYADAMTVQGFSPSGRRMFFNSQRSSLGTVGSCAGTNNAWRLFSYESLHNLVADLQPLRSPGAGGLLMRGTASDINFAGYTLEYANAQSPNDWRPVAVPGTEQKFDETLATWVPPSYGTFLVRLTVQDRAGNSTATLRRVNWSDQPSITDLVKDLDYISPNGDGVQDSLRIRYRVVEPVHLTFEVKDRDGNPVRRVQRDHPAIGTDFTFEWDGRDDQGRYAPDGRYVIRVLDYEFGVEVDTVFPQVQLVPSPGPFNYAAPLGNSPHVEFRGQSLAGRVNTLDFRVAAEQRLLAHVADAGGKPWRRFSFNTGDHLLTWDGLDDEGRVLPEGTYTLQMQVAGQDVTQDFTVELRRPNGVAFPTFTAVLEARSDGGPSSETMPPFYGSLSDRLLDYDSVQVEYGWGDPPAAWNVAIANRQIQSMPAGINLNGLTFGDSVEGIPTASFGGWQESRQFSGLRYRATARDKAGNEVTAVTPYRNIRGQVQKQIHAWFWKPEEADPPTMALKPCKSVPGDGAGVGMIFQIYKCLSFKHVLRELELTMVDNLDAPAVSTEFRYAFIPTQPPSQTDLPLPPIVTPLPEQMASLQWTSIELRDPAGNFAVLGIHDVVPTQHDVSFRWVTPQGRNGVWLYQTISRDSSGNELPSGIHTIHTQGSTGCSKDGPPPPPSRAVLWTAHHEPAQVCEATPTERATVTAVIPRAAADGALFPLIAGQRLYRKLTDGSRVLLNQGQQDNSGAVVNFVTAIDTGDWPLGRHEFEVEVYRISELVTDNQWIKVASPFIYVNHEAPRVHISTPLNGQQMCASRVPVPGAGTIGYLPLAVSVEDRYATHRDVQLLLPGGASVPRGPVAHRTSVLGMPATNRSIGLAVWPICTLPGACEDSGPIVWPQRPGQFVQPPSARLYGAEPGTDLALEAAPLNGQITAQVRAYGPSGHLSCTAVTVDVDGRVEGAVNLNRSLFSPNDDGVLDEVTLTIAAGESLTARIEVFPASRATDGRLVLSEGPAIATLVDGLSLSRGERPFEWDGRNDGGQVVADGLYAFRITLTDGCGNELVELRAVEVDNTPPAIVIDTPRPNALAGLDLMVRGSISDLHPLRYEIVGIAQAIPDVPIQLPNLGSMNRPHVDLATWNTQGLAGAARLVVRAYDTVGNGSLIEVPVTLAEPAQIVTSLTATPDPFSPNGDGRRERLSIQYSLSQPAQVTMTLTRAATNAPIRTLLGAVPAQAGNTTIVWDGRNEAGAVEPDEDVLISITAEVMVNGSVSARQVATALIVLDKTPPVITYTLPRGPVTTGAGGVVAQAVDPLFAQADLSISVQGAAHTPMTEADASGSLRASLDAVPEGPIALRVRADDRAENQSVAIREVIIDRTPPKPQINAPPPEAYISGLRQPYVIEGAIEELHLARYRLSVDAATLLEGTTQLSSTRLLTWNPLTVPDGQHTLTLRAEDQADLVGTVSVPFTVDNTPPVAQIRNTGTPMYLKPGAVLHGTATDVNLLNYRVEIAPGSSSSNRWTEIGGGSQEIRDGALTTLAVLPPDGLYGLRLTVIDKAGNETSALQDVTVDSLPPQAVTLTATLRNRRDADVRWAVASEPDAAGYILFRNGSRVNTALLTTTNYLDANLAAGTYVYTVKVVDRAGNESDPSNEGSVLVSTSEPVAQIFAPTRDAYAAGLMDVRGTANAPADFREYRLFIGNGASPSAWQLLRRSPVPITANSLAAWNTLSLVEGSQYTLRLEAEDLSGVIATDQVTVRVKNTPPNAPIQLQGTLGGGNNIALSWTPNTEPDIQGYLLYRDLRLANATGPVIGSLVPYLIRPAAYNDLGVPDGVHRYFVQAMDMAGNISGPSNEVEFLVDTRPPHVPVVRPANGSTISQTTVLVGESPDTDIARVQFQYRPSGTSNWTDIGAPLTTNAGPWSIEWNTVGLSYGNYDVRAVATDLGGRTDPAPGFITLLLTDLRKPDPATTLTTLVTGGDVRLDWVSSASTYAVGYRIERNNPDGSTTELTSSPLDALTYTDTNLADAAYTYRVYAVSAGGTSSDPSNNAPATVFTPKFVQPYTPTLATSIALQGRTLPTHRVILTTQADETPLLEVASNAEGRFQFDGVALALGDNRLRLIARDERGNASKPASWHAVRGLAPAAPTGLQAVVTGHDVSLSWAANTEADLEGYVPALNGVLRTAPVAPTGYAVSSKASWDEYYGASRAIDSDPLTGWRPEWGRPLDEQWVEFSFATPRNVDVVSLQWADHATPTRYSIEGHDGEVWVPLATLQNQPPVVDVRLAQPYRTDRIRVVIHAGSNEEGVQLNDLRVAGLSRIVERSAVFPGLPDGRPRVGAIAITSLGFPSPLSESTPVVGDAVPPDAPVLQAQAVGSDAHLSWVGPAAPDVAGFHIRRDGQLIATLNDPAARTHVDPRLPNAHYDYVVSAFDTVGNAGLPSNTAGVDIAVGGPISAIVATATAPAGGGVVQVAWTVASGAQPASYTLSRGLTASGPYGVIATGLLGLTYDDRTVQNGVRYYYVVTGVDAVGNGGAVSNEVHARPFDGTPPASPYFVLPGYAPGPVLLAQPQTTLVGFAEPGSRVVISRGDERIGVADASSAAQRQLLEVSDGAFDLTRDGSLLFARTAQAEFISFDGTPVSSPTLRSIGFNTFRFAPDGRSAAITRYVGSTGRDILMKWDRATDQLSTVSTETHYGVTAFSPDGGTILSTSYDSATGQQGVRVIDWATGTSRFVPVSVSRMSWSPDGQRVAMFVDGELRLYDAQLNQYDSVAGSFGPYRAPSWLPDSSGVLVENVLSNGQAEIARVDASTLAVTSLASDPVADLRAPVASPTGEGYLFVRNNTQLVQRGFDGTEQVLDESVGDSSTEVTWASSRAIVYRRNWGELAIRQPAGRFTLPQATLAVGSNVFGAYAVDAAGNTSVPALPLEVRRPADGMPDWAVSEQGWFVFPATPRVGESVTLGVTINSVGAAAPATQLAILAIDEQGGATRIASAPLAAMAAGSHQTVRATWVAPAGRHVLVAVVDPSDTTEEISEDNNRASRLVHVTTVTNGEPQLQVRTDKPNYVGGETVAAVVDATSTGGVIDGTLVTRIVDTGGFEVFRFPGRPVHSLTYGQPQAFTYSWPSGATLAGDYRVNAELLGADGQPLASALSAFVMQPGAVLSAEIATDRAEYLSGDNVQVRGTVRHVSGNMATVSVPAVLTVRAASGDVVATSTVNVQGLLQGLSAEVDLSWLAGPTGPYVARIETGGSASVPSVHAESSFEIVPPTAPLIAGRLRVTGDVFGSTEAIPTTSTVSNRGALLDPLPVRVRAVDAALGVTLATWSGELQGLGAAPIITPATLTGTWPLASFELRLEARVGSQWLLLDRTRVQAAERTPPGIAFAAPEPNAIVRSTATVVTRAIARRAPIARVELQPGSGTWTPMLPQDAAAGVYYSNTLPAEDGPVILQARAADTMTNVSSVATLPIVIDNTPPLITVTGVIDQQVSTTPLTPVVNVTDLHLLSHSVTLDGQSYTPGTQVGTGVHLLAIDAVDRADNRSSTTVRFTVQPLVRVAGTLTVPSSVTLGDVAALAYAVTNEGGTPLADLPLTVRVIDVPSGTVRSSYPMTATLPTGETQAGFINWPAAGEAGQVMVALIASIDGQDVLLDQAPMQVLAPPTEVDLVATARVSKDVRALVLVACRNQGVDDPACLQQRIAAVTTMLHLKGIPFQIVTTEAEFEAQFRCGTHNFYWISSGTHLLLNDQLQREIREAVRRGDGLFIEGEQPSDGEVLRSTTGAWKYDWFEESNLSAEVLPGFGVESGPLATLGVHPRMVLADGAEAVALYDGYFVASARNRVGQGGGSIMAFEFAGMLASPDGTTNPRLRSLLDATLEHSAYAPSLLTIGDAVQLATEVRNRGTQAVDVEARATLPEGAVFVNAEPAPVQVVPAGPGSPAQVVWQFSLAPGASVDLKQRLRLETEAPASIQVPVEIYSRPVAASPVLRTTTTHELPVAHGLALTYAAHAAVQSLVVSGEYEESLAGYALVASQTAMDDFLMGSYSHAITKWVVVASLVGDITTEEPTKLAGIRQAIAMAIEAATDRLCRP